MNIIRHSNGNGWAIELNGEIILSSYKDDNNKHKPFTSRTSAIGYAKRLKYFLKDERFKDIDLRPFEAEVVEHSEPSNSSACDCRTETANGGANKSADAEGLLKLSSGLKMILTTAQLGVLAALIQG